MSDTKVNTHNYKPITSLFSDGYAAELSDRGFRESINYWNIYIMFKMMPCRRVGWPTSVVAVLVGLVKPCVMGTLSGTYCKKIVQFEGFTILGIAYFLNEDLINV